MIPLHSTPSDPHAWHQVRAPGGYEAWFFDAEDVANDRYLVVALFDGLYTHPAYLNRYRRYRRFPTRFAPPVPKDYPAVTLAMYERGTARWRVTHLLDSGAFRGRDDVLNVEVGSNRLWQDANELRLHLELGALVADMTFTPRLRVAPEQIPFGGVHHWIVTEPLCDAVAKIRAGADMFSFQGRGYHEHRWGAEPLFWKSQSLLRGRVLLDNSCFAFQLVQPRGQIAAVEANGERIRPVAITNVETAWSAYKPLRPRYPVRLILDDVLELQNPRIIDSTRYSVYLQYDAICRGGVATGICQMTRPLGRRAARSLSPGVPGEVEAE